MTQHYRLSVWRRLLNVLVKGLVWLGVPPPHTYVLAVRGRTSGRIYTTPVRLVGEGQKRWLVAPYGEREWVKNARAAGVVELRRGRRRETLALREVSGEERGEVLRRYVREVPITRPFFDAKPTDSIEAFEAEGSRHPVFELVSAPAASIQQAGGA
jgi:deazaflavin-dependent oxidoreductase (nitroreductase family)